MTFRPYPTVPRPPEWLDMELDFVEDEAFVNIRDFCDYVEHFCVGYFSDYDSGKLNTERGSNLYGYNNGRRGGDYGSNNNPVVPGGCSGNCSVNDGRIRSTANDREHIIHNSGQGRT